MSQDFPQARQAIDVLPSYKAGRSVSAVSGLTPYKLSSNELPFDPPQKLVDVLSSAGAASHRYPDPFASALTAALAASLGLSADMVALGTGGVGVCQQIVQAFCNAGDEVIFPWRSFEAYPIICGIAGAKQVDVPLLADGTHDLHAMAAAVTDKTRMVFICSPNNPTGRIVRHSDLVAFLSSVPSHVLVVIDEAYIEFNRDVDVQDSLTLLRTFSNVGILRTFSKAFGLAGLRVGYFVAHPPVIEAVRKTAVPFGVSSIAQAVAVEALTLAIEFEQRIDLVVQRRVWLESEFEQRGIYVGVSQGNFVWWQLGELTNEFTELCERYALAVRPFSGEGVRITIGEQEALDRLLNVIDTFVAEHPHVRDR